jgi:hypothetical protein
VVGSYQPAEGHPTKFLVAVSGLFREDYLGQSRALAAHWEGTERLHGDLRNASLL